MPSRPEYKQALNGIPRDQRIAFLYLESLIENKARPVEVIKSENQDWIKERFDKLEAKINSLDALKRELKKTIKDQRKYLDGKVTDHTQILDRLNEMLEELTPSLKMVMQIRDKLIKDHSLDKFS